MSDNKETKELFPIVDSDLLVALDPPTTAAEASSTRDRPHDSSQEKVAFEKIELKPAAETSEKAESTAVLHDLHHQQGTLPAEIDAVNSSKETQTHVPAEETHDASGDQSSSADDQPKGFWPFLKRSLKLSSWFGKKKTPQEPVTLPTSSADSDPQQQTSLDLVQEESPKLPRRSLTMPRLFQKKSTDANDHEPKDEKRKRWTLMFSPKPKDSHAEEN